jgi:murein L,D-transpeptidase YafK
MGKTEMKRRLTRRWWLGALLAVSWGAYADPWLLVDTRAEQLKVMGDSGPLDVFDNIALGVRGAGLKKTRGDDLTPLGSFRVGWINRASQFHRFIGLNYPNAEYAALAYYEGRIDQPTYQAIQRALWAGRKPPQQTPLGGFIGIHGLGPNDPFVHANTNWTGGCVALTDEQIERLLRWVKVGTRVEIR